MRKLSLLITALLFVSSVGYGQDQHHDQSIKEVLQQAANVLNKPESRELWNVALNAPIIIIDSEQDKMYLTGIKDGKVEDLDQMQWDKKVPFANSFCEYNGKRYVTIIQNAILNAPSDRQINLISHEIFHLHQNSLGILNSVSSNSHIDESRGRALLQIEMKALQSAIAGDADQLLKALYIRAYRQSLYPNNNEDLYELNEGLAEYTGAKLSMTNMNEYITNRLNYDISRGYANAFGYITGSAYATILDGLYPKWRYDSDLSRGLIYLIKKRDPQYDVLVDDAKLNKLLIEYDYDKILAAEEAELKTFGNLFSFEELLKPETSKVSIPNDGVSFTYNPNDRLISLGDAVLLRNFALKGEWGQINVKNGIVRLNNWSAFYLLPPQNIGANIVEGDDYQISLNQGWKMAEKDGIYTMIKE